MCEGLSLCLAAGQAGSCRAGKDPPNQKRTGKIAWIVDPSQVRDLQKLGAQT